MQNPFRDFGEVYFAICKRVNTPYSLGCWLRWKGRCFSDLAMPVPERYDSAHLFGQDYLCYSWASKAQLNLEKRDLAQVALDGFIVDEEFNKLTTSRIRSWYASGGTPDVEKTILRLQRKIASILGPLDMGKVLNSCRFGNGATATLPRRRARFDQKITTLPFSVSPGALNLGRAVVESDPAWMRAIIGVNLAGPCSLLPRCFEVMNYNLFDTVPKSLKTDRTIAKEPMLNGFLQQGVHVYLRERLKLTGTDLRDQSRNQRLAGLAHLLKLCTIDGKSASNSVTTALVELLFPVDWYLFLDSLRSKYTKLPDGTEHRNYMFSSMGNAFTFELESLIFYAILHVCSNGSRRISVYGDDMITEQKYAQVTIETLELLGFRINRDKTFVSGRFFESCGSHFFDGFLVTPVYQKKPPRGSLAERIRAHNRLIRWALRSGLGVVLDATVFGACEILTRDSPHRGALFGPIGPEGDDYFQVPYGQYRLTAGFARVNTWRAVHEKVSNRHKSSYAYWLRLRVAGPPSQEGCTVGSNIAVRREPQGSDEAGSPCDALELSARSYESSFVLRKESIPINGIRVDVNWFKD